MSLGEGGVEREPGNPVRGAFIAASSLFGRKPLPSRFEASAAVWVVGAAPNIADKPLEQALDNLGELIGLGEFLDGDLHVVESEIGVLEETPVDECCDKRGAASLAQDQRSRAQVSDGKSPDSLLSLSRPQGKTDAVLLGHLFVASFGFGPEHEPALNEFIG